MHGASLCFAMQPPVRWRREHAAKRRLDMDVGLRREPAVGFESGNGFIPQIVGEWRIEKDQIERMRRLAQPAYGIGIDHARIVDLESRQGGLQLTGQLRITLDEGAFCGAA